MIGVEFYSNEYFDEPDRICTNSSDGAVFAGYDDEEGNTTWYNKNGTIEGTYATQDDWC